MISQNTVVILTGVRNGEPRIKIILSSSFPHYVDVFVSSSRVYVTAVHRWRAQHFLFFVSSSRCNITIMRLLLSYQVSARFSYEVSCYIQFHGNNDNYILPFTIIQYGGPFSDLSEHCAVSNLTIFRIDLTNYNVSHPRKQ